MQFPKNLNQAWTSRMIQRLGSPRWKPLITETRSQILLCYIGLMALFIGIAVPCIYQVLYREGDRRVKADVIEEVQEFRDFLVAQPPGTVMQMQRLIVQYINDDLPEDEQYFVFIVDEQPFASEPKPLPSVMQAGSPLMEQWRLVKRQVQGEWATGDPQVGRVVYDVEPISVDAQVRGVFVIAHTTLQERLEIDRIVRTVLLIMLAILLLAVVLAWLLSARILKPLRSLAMTARSISESDLSQRIAVSGRGELAEVAATFNDMMDRLQVAFTSQKTFIRDASHELRTPITIIQGHLELMGSDPEEQRETLELVHDELDRMNRFVGDMLILAKAGRPDFIQSEMVDLETLTSEIYNKARVITHCNCELSQRGYGKVWLDGQRITQAMLQLVQNADQHTPTTGLITLGSSRSHRHVRFWVTDTGKGIRAQDQNRIFERFARVANQSRQSEGAGLGLSIVHAIVEASGGRITLQSTPGRGATFTLILPVKPSCSLG